MSVRGVWKNNVTVGVIWLDISSEHSPEKENVL